MDDSWFDRVPKVELHVHLEGAIPVDCLWELVRKYGGTADFPDLETLRNRFIYKDFPHFLQTWNWKNGFLREYDDFRFIAGAVATDMASQNIQYAEVIFSPSDFVGHGLQAGKLAEAVRAGLSAVPEIEVSLVADLVRNNGAAGAARILEEVREVKELGIIGITIGGSEHDYLPELFTGVYDKARLYGFHTSAHAGEGFGPESVWGALHELKVERIGHGTRAVEDSALIEWLAVHRVPVEICMLSNVKTRVVASAAAHPVRRYFEMGIPLSINTDDPRMFGNSLAEEYRTLEKEHGFTRDELRALILGGILTSWLSEEARERYLRAFRNDPDWMG